MNSTAPEAFRAVPQSEREAQTLALVADPGDLVLTPPVRPPARLSMREVVPRISPATVILAHRPPLTLTQIRPPRLPPSRF